MKHGINEYRRGCRCDVCREAKSDSNGRYRKGMAGSKPREDGSTAQVVVGGGTPAVKTKGVELIPQEHGGALRRGNPGNKGGPGRTPSEIRELMRQPLAKLLPIITEIAKAKDTQTVMCPNCNEKHEVVTYLKARDKLYALDLLAKYGVGTQKELEHTSHVTLHAGKSVSPE